MSNFVIRSACLDDAPAVDALLQRSYTQLLAAHYEAELLREALPMMTRAQSSLLRCGTWYVAVDADEHLVGCGGWTPERPGSGELEAGLAHLRHFATDPDCVGCGIGRALVMRCFADAAAAGYQRFECSSTLTAEGFYTAMGFATVEYCAVPMGPTLAFPSVLMRCDNSAL